MDQGHILAIEVDDERVGMVQPFERPDVVEVGEIQIAPSHQGRGIGTLVLTDTKARAHAAGKTVLLSSGLQNHRAVKLYERLGFQIVSRTDTHVHMQSVPEQFSGPAS